LIADITPADSLAEKAPIAHLIGPGSVPSSALNSRTRLGFRIVGANRGETLVGTGFLNPPTRHWYIAGPPVAMFANAASFDRQ
jgi:hypothetical protein